MYFEVCTLLLCAGPIAGCSAVLAVQKLSVTIEAWRCAFVVCAEAGSKTEKTKEKRRDKQKEKKQKEEKKNRRKIFPVGN